MTVSVPAAAPATSQAPYASSRRLTDFEGFCELFGQWGGQFHQMSRGQFHGKLHLASGRLIRAFQAETNQEILTRGLDRSSFVTFIPITPESESNVWRGGRLSAGELIVKSPQVEYDNQTGRDAVIRALLVPSPVLRDATRVLTGERMDGELDPWAALRPSPRSMARFGRALASLLNRSIRNPSFLCSPEGNALEHECLRSVVDCLLDTETGVPEARRFDARSALIERAVSFLHDRLDQPLIALDLCAELEVNDRTLRRAFCETFGMGPLAYFRVMRLHAARAALIEARGRDRMVADIARHSGFSRLGPFAAEYRRQFGELPSETLGVRGWPGVQRMGRAVC